LFPEILRETGEGRGEVAGRAASGTVAAERPEGHEKLGGKRRGNVE